MGRIGGKERQNHVINQPTQTEKYASKIKTKPRLLLPWSWHPLHHQSHSAIKVGKGGGKVGEAFSFENFCILSDARPREMEKLPIVEGIRRAGCSPLALVDEVVNSRRVQPPPCGDHVLPVWYGNRQSSVLRLEEHPYATEDHEMKEKPPPPPLCNVGHC